MLGAPRPEVQVRFMLQRDGLGDGAVWALWTQYPLASVSGAEAVRSPHTLLLASDPLGPSLILPLTSWAAWEQEGGVTACT